MIKMHAEIEADAPEGKGRAWGALLVALLLVMSSALAVGQTSATKKKPPAKAAAKKPAPLKAVPHHAASHAKASPHSSSRAAVAAANARHGGRPAPPVFRPTEPVVHGAASVATLPGEQQTFLYPRALTSFFRALAAHQAEASSGSPNPNAESSIPVLASTVRILQFGDSHTAADLFTGALRADLQARFGDGGLGFQFPGHPFAGYHLAGSARGQSSGWLTEGNRFTQLGDGDLGLGGISIATSREGEWVTLSTSCTTLQVQYLRQSGGGRLSFSDNGVHVSDIDTSTDTGDPASISTAGTLTYACTAGIHDFELDTLDHAPVKLLGLVTEQPGITYECLGINGAVAPLMLRWNQQIFDEYLRQRNPALIVLAYGTNEAAGSAAHNEEYVADFDRLLENLHRIVPSASVLVLGPYDRATRIGRGRRATWQTFRGTDRIIADQKESCRLHGCAFYDQRARMGGPGAMLHWAATGLAQADRTHLTGTGYRTMADALYADLLAAYQTYQERTGTPEPAAGRSATSLP